MYVDSSHVTSQTAVSGDERRPSAETGERQLRPPRCLPRDRRIAGRRRLPD